MAIEIIEGKRRLRRFLAYDMEWIPGTLQIRIVGVYDGNRYFSFLTVGHFLGWALSKEHRGKWFYAHAGGLADVQFVLEELTQNPRFAGHTVRASFSGSSAIIVRVSKDKHCWTFVDSYWLLRDKLSEIAKMVDMQKTGPNREDWTEEQISNWYATVPFEELRSYNANDCKILWRAIEAFQIAALDLGGQLQMTLASSAMYLFRRRYLQNRIETTDAINEKARLAYYAARVEVFRRDAPDPANYYDVNSLYPYAMTFPAPGEVIGIDRRLPLGEFDRLFMADVEIEVPDLYLTPIPARLGGRLFFPFGKWRTWLLSTDLNLLVMEGGRIHKVHQVYHFEPFHDLANFARDLYAKRVATEDPVERVTYKLLMNSLYGKFAESEEKSTIHIHPSENTLRRLTFDNMLFPGAWEETLTVPVPHVWVPISGHITAVGRATLYKFLGMTRRYHYCDTDGFSTNDKFSTSTDLGALKLERESKGEKWQFVQPKLYRLGDKVKAKGFSLKRQRAVELFDDLIEGKEITVRRMRRIRENFRKGSSSPVEMNVIKRLNDSLPKRHFNRQGISRPWSIKELKAKGLKFD